MEWKRLGSIGQWLGLVALIVGIVLMVAFREPAGSVAIAVSSLLYASATKLRYYGGRRKRRARVSMEELVGYNGVPRRPLAVRSRFSR